MARAGAGAVDPVNGQTAAETSGTMNKTDLFVVGDGPYKTYRIPALAVTPESTLLAFAAARKGTSDWADIDILLRRSTDGGKTWLKPQTIADAGKGTADNATVIADRRGRVHLLYQTNYNKGFYTFSDDQGASFAKPVDITKVYESYRDRYDWNVIAPGPGHGLELPSGRLIVPIWLSVGGKIHRPSDMAVIYSDDRGKTWEPGPIIARDGEQSARGVKIKNPSESSLALLDDGRILINIRSESKPYRRLLSYSDDGGESWSQPAFEDELFEPICFGSMATMPNGDVLFANPDSRDNPWRAPGRTPNAARENLTVRLSRDDGQTWPVSRVIEPGNAGYSDMAVEPDGTIWCLYERGGRMFQEERMTIARFDRQWIEGAGRNSTSARDKPPNIVFILIDDMGWTDAGCYGSDYYETPHIDRLAQSGMRFTQAYASSSVCSPTRAAILSGKNPARLRITAAIPIQGEKRLEGPLPLIPATYNKNLPLSEVTIAEALGEADYPSASIGKWHVSWDEANGPTAQGFDVNIAGNRYGSTQTYFYPYQSRWRMTPEHPWHTWRLFDEGDGRPGEYLADRLADEAVAFIKDHRDRPFFLYLSHYLVHTPLEAKKDLVRKYKNRQRGRHHDNPVYAAMIDSVDQSVGRVLATLDELGLADDTVVIFTSDNGGAYQATSAHPLRGHKANFYEGGIRVPLIVRWPGRTEAGSTCDTPVISTDFYPTILSMAGLPPRPRQHVDGVDLTPLLEQSGDIDREALIWHFPNYIGVKIPEPATPCAVIRMGPWKLHRFYEDNRVELYNLDDDLGERRNLAAEHVDRVNRMQRHLVRWQEAARVQMPTPNPKYPAKR